MRHGVSDGELERAWNRHSFLVELHSCTMNMQSAVVTLGSGSTLP